MNQQGNKKIAIIHDFLVSYGGAERVLEALAEMYPEAPIYTLLYDKEKLGKWFKNRDIRSFRWRWRRSTCASSTSSSRRPARGARAS